MHDASPGAGRSPLASGGFAFSGAFVDQFRPMRFRWLVVALLILVICFVLASLRGRQRQQQANLPIDPKKLADPARVQGYITVWGWNIAAKSLKSLVPKFNERYRNVHPDVVVSGANLQTRFLLSLAAGTGAPDIMQLQSHETARYTGT